MSANFNLENYETVKERKKRFYTDNPDGSLISEIVLLENDHVVIKGIVYRNKEEQEKGLIWSTGHAEEFQGKGGFANKFAWMENCDESAIGRALDNAGYSGNDKCSREEMKKVENAENNIDVDLEIENAKMLISTANNIADLKKCGLKIANIKHALNDKQADDLRAIYDIRKKEIEQC